MLKHELETDQPSFGKSFLKDNKLLALHICKFSLFHYEIAHGKNEQLKTTALKWYVLGLPYLIRYYKNDFPLVCILTYTVRPDILTL